MTTRLLLLSLVVAALGACATPPRESTSPRVRCLVDPHETRTRPLVFLFCVESP